jgi:hypothetical protein
MQRDSQRGGPRAEFLDAEVLHCIIPAQAIYEPDWRSGKRFHC